MAAESGAIPIVMGVFFPFPLHSAPFHYFVPPPYPTPALIITSCHSTSIKDTTGTLTSS